MGIIPLSMQKLLLLFGIILFFSIAAPVSASNAVCNKTCQVNEDCGQNYRCFVGICRAVACASSPDCNCIVATPTPKVSNTGIENLRVAATPKPKATPMASPTSVVKKAPRTGSSLELPLTLIGSLGFVGWKLLTKAKNS